MKMDDDSNNNDDDTIGAMLDSNGNDNSDSKNSNSNNTNSISSTLHSISRERIDTATSSSLKSSFSTVSPSSSLDYFYPETEDTITNQTFHTSHHLVSPQYEDTTNNANQTQTQTYLTQLKACQLAKQFFQEDYIDRDTHLVDMTDNFPKFTHQEIQYGNALGKGGFGIVYEVRGFDLKNSNRNTIEIDDDLCEEPDSSMERQQQQPRIEESRRFMARHVFRKYADQGYHQYSRYAVKSLKDEIVNGDPKHLVTALLDIVLEARILSALPEHPNIIKLRGVMSGDRFVPNFFLILDRLYETLEQRIQFWRQQQTKTTSKNLVSRILLPRLQRLNMKSHINSITAFSSSRRRNNNQATSSNNTATSNTNTFNEDQILLYAYELSSAIEHMHHYRLIHRDLKPENIGFDVRDDIKIFDFGLAKELPPLLQPPSPTPQHDGGDATTNANGNGVADKDKDPTKSDNDNDYDDDDSDNYALYRLTGMCGSPRYMAGEVAHKRMYNEKCDVYSFAIVFYEMISLEPAYEQHKTIQSLLDNVWNPPYERPILSRVPYFHDTNNNASSTNNDQNHAKIVKNLIRQSWHSDLHKRPNMAKINQTLKEVLIASATKEDDSSSLLLDKEGPPHHRRRKSRFVYDKQSKLFRLNSNELD